MRDFTRSIFGGSFLGIFIFPTFAPVRGPKMTNALSEEIREINCEEI